MKLKVAAWAVALIFVAIAIAWAATTRPNAADVRVDHLTDTTLSSSPATALVDPERQTAAHRLETLTFPGWAIAVVIQIVVLAYIWRSGLAARLRDRFRRMPGGDTAMRFRFGAVLALIVRLAALLPEFYLYRVSRMMSLSDQLLRAWGTDWLIATAVAMVATGLVVVVIMWLVDRTHQWYLYAIAIVFVASYGLLFIKPYVISPFFDRFVPLPASAAAVGTNLEKLAHVNIPIVMRIRSRTHLGTAYVEGLGASERIVLGDAVPAVSSTAELRYIIANQLGYVAAGDSFRIALLNALCIILGAAVAVGIADRIGFRRDDDPVTRLALVGALLGAMYLIVLPFNNAALRRLARENNTYALALTGERAAAVRSIVRGTDQGLHDVCPDVIESVYFSRVDSPSKRVAAINGVPSGCP